MKVLLLTPPFYRVIGFYNRYFPFAITVLGTHLREHGHRVVVYDADFNEAPVNIDYAQLSAKYADYLKAVADEEHPVWRELRAVLAAEKPDLVGISTFTTFAASAFRAAAVAKSVLPGCPIVIGGPHASARAEETLRICPQIEFAVRGEGEEALLELAAGLERGSPSLSSIEGLSWREGGSLKHNPPRGRSRDADHAPDRTLLRNEATYSSEDMGLIMTSRGCPYSCTYCATDTRRVAFRAPEAVLDEIRAVRGRYGTTQFTFKDDSFTVNRRRVVEICELLLESRLPVRWECNTRLNLIDADLLRLMRRAGCNFIKVGIESGSERILERMEKGLSLSDIRAGAALLRRSGIHWTGYFMMGVPGETREDVLQTVELMRELKPDLALVAVYEAFPGTAMFEDGVARGLLKRDMALGDYFGTAPNHYFKIDPARQVDTMGPEEWSALAAQVNSSFHSYNNRPGRVARMGWAKLGVYAREPRILWADFHKYLGYASTR